MDPRWRANYPTWAFFTFVCCSTIATCYSAEAQTQPKQPQLPSVRWRADGRCGEGFPLPDDSLSECDPRGELPCCSDYGFCGISPSHCNCRGCIDYRNQITRCYLRLEGDEGIFESPNYPNPYPADQDCEYEIVRASEDFCGVKITVEDLDIATNESTEVCTRDWIGAESCAPQGSARLCGNDTSISYQYNFQPDATAMRFLFHSDSSGSGRGFRFKYQMLNECNTFFGDAEPSEIPGTSGATCFTKISELSGTINTPFYPKKYPENMDCVYEFIRNNPSICGVKMKSTTFDLEIPLQTPFGGACSDYFHMPTCGFLCGKLDFTWIARYQPGATSLHFHFHSDESLNLSGFLVSFEQVTEC